MIDVQAELNRIQRYMQEHMPSSLWGGIKLEGGLYIVAFSVN